MNWHITYPAFRALTWRACLILCSLVLLSAMPFISVQGQTTEVLFDVSLDVPAFLRVGDSLTIGARVVNYSDILISGTATLEFINPASGKILKGWIVGSPIQALIVNPVSSGRPEWKVAIPIGIPAIRIRVSIKNGSGTFEEEETIQVLSTRVSAPTSNPMNLGSAVGTSLKLSSRMVHHPVWELLLSIPSRMESPPECVDNILGKFYAGTLAARLVGTNPRILKAQSLWGNAKDTSAFLLNISQNPDIQTIIKAEAPWLLRPRANEEKDQRILQWIDMATIARGQSDALSELSSMMVATQRIPGQGFIWFPGFPSSNRVLSQCVLADLIKLIQTGLLEGQQMEAAREITKSALENLDRYWVGYFYSGRFDFQTIQDPRGTAIDRLATDKKHISDYIQWLYLHSYSSELPDQKDTKRNLENAILSQEMRTVQDLGMLALILNRTGDKERARKLVRVLSQRAIRSKEYGMYWREPASAGMWENSSLVGTQTLMAEVYQEVTGNGLVVNDILKGLLRHPNISRVTSLEALDIAYSLLVYQHAVTGEGALQAAPVWLWAHPGLVRPSRDNGLTLQREYYCEVVSPQGVTTKILQEGDPVKVGDIITVRLTHTLKQFYFWVLLKDSFGAGFELVDPLPRIIRQTTHLSYQNPQSTSMNFYLERATGTGRVFEYKLRAVRPGSFSNGEATIQCLYAPEFSASTGESRITIR